MKTRLNILKANLALAGIMTLLLTSLSSAAGTSGAQFLKLGAGAKAAAMGSAFSSLANDVTATYWNPAGLTQISSPELSLMENSWLMDSQYQFLGFAVPSKNHAWGVSMQRMDFGSIDRYDNSNNKNGSFTAGSMAGGITFAGKWNEQFRYGLTGKFVREAIESESASTFAGDLGIMFQQGIYNFSATVQNVGPGLKFVQETSPLPETLRIGAAAKMLDEKLLLSVEASKPNDNKTTLHTGIDYQVVKVLNLRAGYQMAPGNRLDVNGLTDISAGMGINLGNFSLDYAFLPFGDLGASHQISLLIKFN